MRAGVALMVVASGFLILTPQHAGAATEVRLTPSNTGGPATGAVAVSGSGFAAAETVDLAVGTAPVATVAARADGTLPATTVAVPAGTQPGYIQLTAVGRTSNRTAQARYAVKSG